MFTTYMYTSLIILTFIQIAEKHENWKTTWELLTEMLERMKGHSNKPNMLNISEMLLEFY